MFKGAILYKDGSKYEGEVKNTKLKEGKGKTFNTDGSLHFDGINFHLINFYF
jgi:hypothetical protein